MAADCQCSVQTAVSEAEGRGLSGMWRGRVLCSRAMKGPAGPAMSFVHQ